MGNEKADVIVSFESLWSLNFMQNIRKTNEPILKRSAAVTDEQYKSGNFRPFDTFSCKQEFTQKFGCVSFGYLWSVNFIENIKKLMSQS